MTLNSLPGPVLSIPVADIPEVRARVLAEGEELLARADDGALSADDAQTVADVERVVRILDQRTREAESAANRDPRMSRLIEAGTVSEPRDVPARAVGNLTPVAFTGEQLRGLHDGLMHNTPTSVTAETRDVLAANAPMATVSAQVLDPVAFPREGTRIADFIPTQSIDAPTVTFYRQTTAATAAATVAEGGTKPESSPVWTAVVATARKMAHFADVSTEALSDFGNFEAVIRAELIGGLILKESDQIINGDGIAPNLTGLLNAVGILTYAPGGAEARWLSILHAQQLLRSGTAFAEPDVVVLHPADWEILAKTTATTAGTPIITPDPRGQGPTTIWGTRLLLTTQIASGTGMVANLAQAAVVFEREAPTVKVDPYSQSSANLVRVIAEERLALGVTKPTAIAKITFNGVA